MRNASAKDILKELLEGDDAAALMEEGGEEDYLQPLINLGYLNLAELDTTTGFDSALVEAALRQFVADAHAAGFSEANVVASDWGWAPDAGTLEWMQDLIAVEGESTVPALPQVGEQSLWTRILQYQLWVFTDGEQQLTGAPWSDAALAKFTSFADLLKLQTPKALRLLGDVNEVIDTLLESPNFWLQHPKIAVFQLDGDDIEEFENKRPFLRLLKDLDPSEYEALEPKIKKPDKAWAEGIYREAHNRFVLRLVRVYQWVHGYYEGDLGPKFGAKSFESLRELADLEGRREMKELAVPLSDGYWAMNILYLLQRIDDPDTEAEDTATEDTESKFSAKKTKDGVESDSDESAEEDEETDSGKPRRKPGRPKLPPLPSFSDLGQALNGPKISLLKLMEAVGRNPMVESMQAQLQARREKLKKGFVEYRGSRSILATAFKFAERIRSWIKNAIDRVKGIVNNIAGFLSRSIRNAFRIFADGMSMLMGKRLFQTNNAVVSDFDFDFDLVTFIDTNVTPEDAENHSKTLLSKTQSLGLSLSVVGKTIHFIYEVATGPVGWFQLGMEMAGFVKELLKGKFKLSELTQSQVTEI